MDAKQFLAVFGYIANAPGGIQRLRELILSFAVRGRLVQQELDESNTVNAVRSLILKRKKNDAKTRFRILDEIRSADTLYEIPDNWLWVRLGEVVEILDGLRRPITKQHRKVGPYPYYGASGIVDYVADFIFDEPLILVGEDGAKWACGENSAFKISGKTWVNNHAHVLRPLREFILDDYLVYSFIEMDLSPFITGMTVPKLNQARLISIPLSLPPLEEQSRIVAKVDELMALCDKLETQQQLRSSLQNNLRQTILQAVAASTSPSELEANWTHLADNFGQLLQAPQDVVALRDVIFDLALRGGLLPNSMINATKSEDELPLLPVGWDWQTLGELAEYITSGSRGWKGYISTSGDAFIRSQDIKHDALIFENPVFVSLPEKVEGKRSLVQQGDLLLTITGGNVGKCARVSALGFNAYVSQHVALIRIKKPEQSEFIHFWMTNSYGGRKFLSRYIYGDKPGLNLFQVASVPVPVPPPDVLEEIVKQLKHYGIICDQLLEKIKNSSKIAELFAAASVSAITGITTESEEDESLKALKTELIAPLRLGTTPSIKEQAPLAAILAHQNGEMAAKDLWQRFGGEIDAFYAQLKLEVGKGWIEEPAE